MDVAAPSIGGITTPGYRRRRMTAVGAGVTLVLTAIAAALGATADTAHPVRVAVARGLIVGTPMAVGLYARSRPAAARFGAVLIAAGVALAVSTLAESDGELLYTIGRAAGWWFPVVLVYLVLAFPSGRLPELLDRRLVQAMALVVLVLFMPRLLLADSFEVPSPYTSCVAGCPGNAFQVFDAQGFVAGVLRPLGALATFGGMLAVVVRVWRRTRAATPISRRLLLPMVAVAASEVALIGVGIVWRQADPDAEGVEIAAWTIALLTPVMALAFFAGLLRWEVFAGQALQRIVDCLRTTNTPRELRHALAEALDDPTLSIVFPADGVGDGWADEAGRRMPSPAPGDAREMTEVRRDGQVVAALVHDAGFAARPDLVHAGAVVAAVALDNQRLTADAAASMRELEQSRTRLAASAEQERRRIERDLHDGAQQRLVALLIELQIAEELVRRDPERGAERLQRLELDVQEALEELRNLAHGVYPPLLADRGLVDAVKAVAARSSVRVELEQRGVGRYAPEVESAVYFCILEALQNVLKHATGARRVVVRLDGSLPSELRFSVRDDGAGVARDTLKPGAGMTNMNDRMAAFGGKVGVSSAPGVGTTVSGRVPAARLPAA